jgi:hypothetical protein
MSNYFYDVYISYAIEDKQTVAAPLAHALKETGLKVYFVGDELEAGDSISGTIYNGLEQSRFCVVILSTSYVRKWPAIERSHILHRERKTNSTLVFPVWNNIEQEDVARLFPELADHYAPSMSAGLDAVVRHLTHAMNKRKRHDVSSRWKKIVFAVCMIIGSIVLLYSLAQNRHGTGPEINNPHPVQPDN